jgi:drug/metabolite transporter (DMT)-like permease
VAIVYALLAAVLYGVADYSGGRASRRMAAVAVTLIADATTLVGLALIVPRLGDPVPPLADLAWGAGAGLAGVIGVIALYHGLANGAMTVLAPITAVVAAGIPVTIGLSLGERPGPAALAGIAVALIAVALISGAIGVPHVRTPPALLLFAVLAGTGFGLLFVFYDRISTESGLWPLLAARVVASPLLVVAFLALRRSGAAAVTAVAVPLAVVVGVLATSANIAYVAATRRGLLSIVAVVVSMYPASTVLLATVLDGERLRRPQAVGLGLAALALALVAVGR